jgi:sulfur carrier protein
VQITVNGRTQDLAEGTTLTMLVRAVSDRETGIAVALNNEVVRHGAWTTTELNDGDRIDIVTAVQGG